MKKISFVIVTFFIALCSVAQRTVIHDDGIHSLRMETRQGIQGLPVLFLNGDDRLNVSFDDMTHEYRRFFYRIEHVGADFVSDEGLFDSEYMEADDGELIIEDYESSLNTTVLYNHYKFSLPNAGMCPLLSGNYRLTVRVEDENGDMVPVLETFFAVVNQKTSIGMHATTNTDIDHNDSHQQLDVEVNHRNLELRDPSRELKIVVVQNDRWDNAVVWPKPTSQTGFATYWKHCRQLIFPAGNEYRKFEQISTRYSGMNVDNLRYFDPYYYVTLRMDAPRENYLYDEDQNGIFVFRADGSGNPDTEADYMWVLFRLEMSPLCGKDVYVDGLWAESQFSPKCRMSYNEEHGAYEALVFLKQGYYSYQYLSVSHGGKMVGNTSDIEGDYFQTENDYTIFVYYRPVGARYDQLVGWRKVSYKPQ